MAAALLALAISGATVPARTAASEHLERASAIVALRTFFLTRRCGLWFALFASYPAASVVLRKVLCVVVGCRTHISSRQRLNSRVAALTVVVLRFTDEFVVIIVITHCAVVAGGIVLAAAVVKQVLLRGALFLHDVVVRLLDCLWPDAGRE